MKPTLHSIYDGSSNQRSLGIHWHGNHQNRQQPWNRTKRLSSTQDFLSQECKNLKGIYLKSKYHEKLIDSAINCLQHPTDPAQTPSDSPIRITLKFKDQKSADVVRRQQPLFASKKMADHLRVTEEKPPWSTSSEVYKFTCDLCDTNYIEYTCRHLCQHVEEHKHSVIGKHFRDVHGLTPDNLIKNFKVIKKCRGKFECLIYGMLWIKNKRPKLNTQADSIRTKLFTWVNTDVNYMKQDDLRS